MLEYVTLRQAYLVDEEHSKTIRARTVFINGIPKDKNNEKYLRELFDKFYGGVEHIHIVK